MSEPAIDLDSIDAAWDDEPESERSGIRTRPQTTAPGKPPLPLQVVARRLVTALDVAAWAREELADRMTPGQRIEAAPGVWVEAVSARVSAAGEVVGRHGVRVVRRRSGG